MEEPYLTEKKLVNFLRKHLDVDGIHNKQFDRHRFRPDFVTHKHKLVVEFDGYLHYTKAKTAIDDYRKNEIINEAGYTIIRIPYFVQLDKKIMNLLFSQYMTEPQYDYVLYQHGFIDKKAVLPADFCSLGISRFYDDLKIFDIISKDILASLSIIEKEYNEVYPLNFSW